MKFFTPFGTFFTYIARFFLDVPFPPRETELLVRNAAFTDLEKLIAPRTIVPDSNSDIKVITLLPYHSKLVQAFILEAKFHRNRKAQEFLGKVFTEYLTPQIGIERNPPRQYVLVPIPLGEKRLKQRGYNQVEEILKHSSHQNVRVLKLLRRTRETTPQTSLGKEARLENMRGVFGVIYSEHIGKSSDCTYILIDDVVTTGASLFAAYEALRVAGFKNIQLLALAH